MISTLIFSVSILKNTKEEVYPRRISDKKLDDRLNFVNNYLDIDNFFSFCKS